MQMEYLKTFLHLFTSFFEKIYVTRHMKFASKFKKSLFIHRIYRIIIIQFYRMFKKIMAIIPPPKIDRYKKKKRRGEWKKVNSEILARNVAEEDRSVTCQLHAFSNRPPMAAVILERNTTARPFSFFQKSNLILLFARRSLSLLFYC